MPDKLKDFQNGFNNGYILSKHAPELAELIIKTPNDHSEYFQGIMAGNQEYKIEKIRERFKTDSPNIVQSKDTDKDIEKEK